MFYLTIILFYLLPKEKNIVFSNKQNTLNDHYIVTFAHKIQFNNEK